MSISPSSDHNPTTVLDSANVNVNGNDNNPTYANVNVNGSDNNPTTVIANANGNGNSNDHSELQCLLESARPFLRGELDKVDPNLPSLMTLLRSLGANECSHKHGTFLDHLFYVYRILKLWGAPDSICLCALFHSAYSNSYVDLSIFDPVTGRDSVRAAVGVHVERLVYLFCSVPRQPIVYDDLVFHYTESELVEHLHISHVSLHNMKEKGLSNKDEKWRVKINSLMPQEGIVVKHIWTGEDISLSRRIVAAFLFMTIADTSDQLFSFQDALFDNFNGRREFTGNNYQALWPGDCKPGLWMNSISRIGAVYNLIVREEEIMMLERKRDGVDSEMEGRDEDIELLIPPVFNGCTTVLDAGEQTEARDLYWEAVCEYGKIGLEKAEELLLKSIEKNPFVGEPHVVLAHLYLGKSRFEEAEIEAEKGLKLLLQWASPWDKRKSWEAWVAWTRLLLMRSKKRSWPQTAFGIINLGLLK